MKLKDVIGFIEQFMNRAASTQHKERSSEELNTMGDFSRQKGAGTREEGDEGARQVSCFTSAHQEIADLLAEDYIPGGG